MTVAQPLYDGIGRGYRRQRTPDARLAAAIAAALGRASSVTNVGAGTGSYEPGDRYVVAVEPSGVMIAQRAASAAPAVQARAEALPFADRSFDAAMGVLTLHHWSDAGAGLAECARVARERVVVVTWDPASDGFWLVQEYFPEIVAHDRLVFPALDTIAAALGAAGLDEIDVRRLSVPADCSDGFLGAYWRRPERYLDPAVRAGMSSFARVRDAAPGLARLAADLASGAWGRRHAALAGRDALDAGYRIVVARRGSAGGA